MKPKQPLAIGDHIRVKLTSGRIVEAQVKTVQELSKGTRLHVFWGTETAVIYEWQIVRE